MKQLVKFLVILCILLFSTSLYAQEMYVVQFENHREYDVFIDGPIANVKAYRRICLNLKYAKESDIITFHINTTGGGLFSCTQLCTFIKESRAKTIAHIIRAYSAGSILAFACDEIVVNDYSVIMIHSFLSGCRGGEESIISIANELKFFEKLNKKVVYDFFEGILTMREVKDILENGKDVYLDGKELRKRLDRK